jgi:hypothetical protein
MENVEAALAATTAPRVTAERIQAVIVGQAFARLTGTLTVCVLTLVNGFTVTGESACASPENYDQDIGEHYARKDAERKIWPLEGYLLRQQLHDATMPEIENLDLTEQPVPLPTDRREYGKGELIPPDRFMDRSAPDIGFAVSAMRNGARVARAGWNGKGMFAYLVPAASYPVQTGAAKAFFGEGSVVPYREYMALKTVDGDVAVWVPSVSDILATDWFVLTV